MSHDTWVFITDRRDGHADRFQTLFLETNPQCEHVVVSVDDDGEPRAQRGGADLMSWADISASLDEAAVVISGPLDTVSRHLVLDTADHVGISWATDIMVSAAESAEVARGLEGSLQRMSAVITDNYATEQAFISMGVAEERILRVPWGPGVLVASGNPVPGAGVAQELGLPIDRELVLYPRSLEPHYDPLAFVEAFAALVALREDVAAVLVESGSLVPKVKEEVARLGLRDSVLWVKPLESSGFHALIQEASLVVVTPHTDGTSVTVMEAMALGTPVVSSLTAGSAQWVLHGITGWTYPVGNAEMLAAAMATRFEASEDEVLSMTYRAQRLVHARAGWARSSAIVSKALERLGSPQAPS